MQQQQGVRWEQKKIRVKLKLFELCLMPTILHELAAWGRILTR